jgi:tRNA pseudouridine55 synthase
VTIHDLRVTDQPDADHTQLEMRCGKGAYVRAVVRDLAEQLGACAHVSSLRRTAVGAMTEARAIGLEKLEDLCDSAARSEVLLPVETALDDIPALALTTEDAFRLTQGRSIVLLPRQAEALKAKLKEGSRIVSAFEGERIVALCEMRAGRLNPVRVFQLT